MPYFIHAHHYNRDGICIEWHPEGYYEYRLKEIKAIKILEDKPWQNVLRKQLFKEVKMPPGMSAASIEYDAVPVKFDTVCAEYETIRAELDTVNPNWCIGNDKFDTIRIEVRAAYRKWYTAGDKWTEALCAYGLDRIHRELCVPDCPWDGKGIF